MATMMKEKPRVKKKTKENRVLNTEISTNVPSTVNLPISKEEDVSTKATVTQDKSEDLTSLPSSSNFQEPSVSSEIESSQKDSLLNSSESSNLVNPLTSEFSKIDNEIENPEVQEISSQNQTISHKQGVYEDVCHRLDIISFKDVPVNPEIPINELETKLEASSAYLNQATVHIPEAENMVIAAAAVENMTPSAPIFEENVVMEIASEPQESLQEVKPVQLQCMPLEVAMHICGGKEMAEIRAMSEREEALVEAGMALSPEHPLVDLLSTYRCSAIALEQENQKILKGYSDEEKSRSELWKIEKRTVSESVVCNTCKRSVSYKGTYDYATLLKEKLPAAQLRLEGLLKDAKESYCHHQHQALLAYYQIEEFISEVVQGSAGDIREALTLVLQELRASGATTCLLQMEYFIDSLKRWARALCGPLLSKSDPRQLLFLLHQLSRQSHSVRWAAPLIRIPMCDGSDAARAMAILDLLLAAPALETAKECTEAEDEEMWEEVDRRGEGGAVSPGALRERDLLALLQAFPLRALVARLVLLQRSDITQTRPYEWEHPARDVLRACCGVRALLATLTRAACARAAYSRLRGELRALAAHAMHAVAELHRHNRESYPGDMEAQIAGELEAIFRSGWALLGPAQPPPAALLRPAVRKAYCVALVTHIHEKTPLVVECISLELPALSCGQCVRVAAQAADCDRDAGDTLPMVADFLVQVALKPKKICTGECIAAARECLPTLLVKHDYLFTRAVHSIAYVHQLEPLQPSSDVLKPFSLHKWRPSPGEIRAVLDDWSQRSPQLLQHLLQELSYTPYDGLSLESQLAVGSWLCALPAPAPDWAWSVLTRLRVHRSSWRLPLDAPAPECTEGVFAEAYAVLSSSWGHSLPVICEHGVSALLRVAAARAAAAAHALPLVMAAMMDSPESVALTPQFASLLSSLLAPPQSLVQWACGARAATPALLLRRALAHVEHQPSPAARDAAVSTWLHGLCHAGLSGAALAACDAVLLATRHSYTLQEAPKPDIVSHLVRNAQHAPLACAGALYAAHVERELSTQLFPKLLVALSAQRVKGQKIHVDNALKQIGSSISSEELVIYQTAAALLAPAGQPSLPLWRLLMHLYLHSYNTSSDPAPVGPCFFSGLIKSRTLSQLKKRLHDTILYHHNQADTFKSLLNTRIERKSPSRETKSVTPESVVPRTSIADLTGESTSDCETESEEEVGDESESEERRRVNVNMLAYHEAAEKMLREYECWLEAGERLRATPLHADITRFIPDAALNTARAEQLNSIRPALASEDDDLRAPRQPPAPEPPLTALQSAVARIMRIKDRSERRSQVPVITSPVGDVSFSNRRQLYMLVDKHLADLQTFARQWAADVNRVATLNSKLWPLVRSLRYRKALAPVRKMCANKCGTVVLSLENHYEWPISERAARGIAENRSSAKVALRELLRARPQEAKTVAALHTIARRISDGNAAVSTAARAWGCARDVGDCGAARAALVAVLDRLAERWICSDTKAVLSLLPAWCAAPPSGAQAALCRTLAARAAGCAGATRLRLYGALLQTLCVPTLCEPQHAFSYLSKFDLSRCVDETSRALVLEALVKAAQVWGRDPDPELNILLELIGVHLASLTTAPVLGAVSCAAARAAAAGRLPSALLAHVARAATCAGDLPFDKLGHLLRELGSVWWHARSALKTTQATYHASYAQHVAALQHTLLRAFVARGKALSYAPERVSLNAWSALQESWGAWVSPHPELAPLLPSGEDSVYTTMLRLFLDNVHQMMLDCPGCEERLLSLVWEWTIQIYLNVTNSPGALDSRIQMSELLAQQGGLPWSEHQWPRASCLPAALQISSTSDLEMQTWLADTLRGVEAATWLRDSQDCDTAPRLAALLQLFAGPLPLRTETLEQAALLPWHRLPELALNQALERFFVEHHNPLHPYHDTPQFRVILAASGLSPAAASSRPHRACAVSQWTRAAGAPALLAHVAAQAVEMLSLLAALEPYVEEDSDELEELVGRAAVIMCMEPAAAEALPVWKKWIVNSASPRLLRACVCAARVLTALEYFAPVADAAAAALLTAGGTWAEIGHRLSGSALAEPPPLLAKGCLHAAYALALTAPAQLQHLATVTCFAEKELIISVWICVMCRTALGDDEVQSACARAQLARWGEPPRMALLRVLSSAAEPTYKHRLLCRLALCIITPNSETLVTSLAQAHQACPGVLVSQLDLVSWARAPSFHHLPMLALALFPGSENYFAEEVRIAAAM